MTNKLRSKIVPKAKKFSIALLEAIIDLAEILPKPFESKYDHQRRLYGLMRGYSPQRISKGVYKLRKRGLITKKNTKRLELTLEGKQKLLVAKVNTKSRKRATDGRSTIVIFDIPEEKAKHRQFLRRLLLRNDFINLQKSVLISPNDLPREFFELLEELNLRQNVSVIKGVIQYR